MAKLERIYTHTLADGITEIRVDWDNDRHQAFRLHPSMSADDTIESLIYLSGLLCAELDKGEI